MKKFFFIPLLILGSLFLASCEDDDPRDSIRDINGCKNEFSWVRDGYQTVYVNHMPMSINGVTAGDSMRYTLKALNGGVFKATAKYFNKESENPSSDPNSLPGGNINIGNPEVEWDFTYPLASGYILPCGDVIFQSMVPNMEDMQELYRFDVAPEDYWETYIYNRTGDGFSVKSVSKVVANNVSVQVPAGKFPCTYIQMETTTGSATIGVNIYVNKNVGIVKVSGDMINMELARTNTGYPKTFCWGFKYTQTTYSNPAQEGYPKVEKLTYPDRCGVTEYGSAALLGEVSQELQRPIETINGYTYTYVIEGLSMTRK